MRGTVEMSRLFTIALGCKTIYQIVPLHIEIFQYQILLSTVVELRTGSEAGCG